MSLGSFICNNITVYDNKITKEEIIILTNKTYVDRGEFIIS